LEKDLYYYKMTSREFKKRLRGSMNRDGAAAQSDSSEGSRQSSAEPTAAVGHTDVAAAGDAAVQSSGLSIRLSVHSHYCSIFS